MKAALSNRPGPQSDVVAYFRWSLNTGHHLSSHCALNSDRVVLPGKKLGTIPMFYSISNCFALFIVKAVLCDGLERCENVKAHQVNLIYYVILKPVCCTATFN